MFLWWIRKTVSSIVEALALIGLFPPPHRHDGPESITIIPPPAKTDEVKITGEVPRFFALLIGINKYQHAGVGPLTNLMGCVADCEDMFDYLVNSLGVRPQCIIKLQDEQATRARIRESFQQLSLDARIRPGDPILIFFAGHGSQTKAPTAWRLGDTNIEMLIPHDFYPIANGSEDTQGLYDVTVGKLLSKLARTKGDNIVGHSLLYDEYPLTCSGQTVIFDSCHSGSSTRTNNPESGKVRGFELPVSYRALASRDDSVDFSAADTTRKLTTTAKYEKAGTRSHVLLAATSAGSTARESKGRGEFTKALLQLLRDPSVRAETLTYQDVVNRLPDLPQQIPQLEGVHSDRILFNARAPTQGRILYRVTLKPNGPPLLGAGEAQGILEGAKFALYGSPDITATPIIELEAGLPRACRTPLRNPEDRQDFKFSLPSSVWALQTHVGPNARDVAIALPPHQEFVPLLSLVVSQMNEQREGRRNIQLVDLGQPHELAITLDGGYVAFDLTDKTCVDHNLRRIPHRVSMDPGTLYNVFVAAADYFFNLRRSNKKRPLAKYISIKALLLEESDGYDDASDTFMPARPEEDLNEDGIMLPDVGVSERDDSEECKMYGFRIASQFNAPLYVWVFAFDMTDLSVEIMYQPTRAKYGAAPDPSLSAMGELCLGYGSGGIGPQRFMIPSEESVGVTYLKVFVTSEYVDLSYMKQSSPFGNRKMTTAPVKKELWDTLMLAIVQKSR